MVGETLIINKIYKIKSGIIKGFIGTLIAYDALENEAILKLDEVTNVITTSENLQEFNCKN